jgi:hypothetical protein
MITSRVGYRIPYLRAGIVFLSAGNIVASHEKKRQKVATSRNWTRVRVAGFGKAFRIDFEEVLVRAEEKYHTMQSIYTCISTES